MLKFRLLASVSMLALSLPLQACVRFPTDLVAQATSATPVQVAGLADAEEAFALAAHVTSGLVRGGAFNRSQRATIRAAAALVQADVIALRADRDHGRPLVFTAINAALADFNAVRGK